MIENNENKRRNNNQSETAAPAGQSSTLGGSFAWAGGGSPFFSGDNVAENTTRRGAFVAVAAPVSQVGATFPPVSNRGSESGKKEKAAPSLASASGKIGARCSNSQRRGGASSPLYDSAVFAANADGGSAVSLCGFWETDFLDRLRDYKQTLIDSNVPVATIGRDNDFEIKLYQNGKGASSGGQPASFILDYLLPDGLAYKVYLSRCSTPGVPNVYVQLHYALFRRYSVYDAIQVLRLLLSSVGYRVERLTISRLDVNVTANIPMSYFTDAVSEGRVLLSARKYRVYQNRDKVETFESGTRGQTVVLRVYDKISELQAKYDPVKVADLQSTFADFSNVTRFEFEFCRDVLRKFEIVDEEDLVDKLSTLLDWATKRAFRIESKTRRRADRHAGRVVFDRVFEKIRRAFLAFAEKLSPCVLASDVVSYVRRFGSIVRSASVKVARRIRKKSTVLLKAGVSTVTTALSRLSTRPLEREKMLRVLFEVFFKQQDKIYNRYKMRFHNVG